MRPPFRRKGSPYWHVDYRDAQGRRIQRCTFCEKKSDAQALLDKWRREALRDPADLARERATWSDAQDLVEQHLEESVSAGRMSDATAKFHAAKLTQLTKVFTSARLLSKIGTPAAVRDYLAARRAGSRSYADHTAVKELVTLRLALQLARERGLWAGDLDALQPAELRARYTPRDRVLTPEEVDALRAALPADRWRPVAFGLATGGELSTWFRAMREDYDAEAQLVRVRGTKRAARARFVPIVLYPCAQLLSEALDGPDQAGAFLFAAWPNCQRDLRVAAARAKIPHLSANDLRRTFATWHAEQGIPLELLMRAMGHTSPQMLARVYARPKPARVRELMLAALERSER